MSPGVVLPRILDQLKEDINVDALNALTELDFGIWATPEGTTYVDGPFFYVFLMCKNVLI